jgi:hypothetical protein
MKIGPDGAPLLDSVAFPEEWVAEPVPVAAAGVFLEGRLVLGNILLEGLRSVRNERDMGPGMAADVHAVGDPGAQGLPRVGIIVEFAGVHEAVRAIEVIPFQYGGEPGGDSVAGVAGRQHTGGGQVVEGQGEGRMGSKRRKLKRGCRMGLRLRGIGVMRRLRFDPKSCT